VAEQSLGRVAGDFLATVLLSAERPPDLAVEPAQLRAQLRDQLAALSSHPIAVSLDAQELEDARFALVAFADEALLTSQWPGREQWSHELLQQQYFRTNRGGDEFYDRLARLRPDQSAARHVYFLCLVLGFEGQLVGDEARRRALIQQQYDLLRAAGLAKDALDGEALSPEAYAVEVHLEPPSSGTLLRILVQWGGGAAALLIVLWGILILLSGRVPLPPGA
jgi:type VI secretion system protein ImpK